MLGERMQQAKKIGKKVALRWWGFNLPYQDWNPVMMRRFKKDTKIARKVRGIYYDENPRKFWGNSWRGLTPQERRKLGGSRRNYKRRG